MEIISVNVLCCKHNICWYHGTRKMKKVSYFKMKNVYAYPIHKMIVVKLGEHLLLKIIRFPREGVQVTYGERFLLQNDEFASQNTTGKNLEPCKKRTPHSVATYKKNPPVWLEIFIKNLSFWKIGEHLLVKTIRFVCKVVQAKIGKRFLLRNDEIASQHNTGKNLAPGKKRTPHSMAT